MENPHGFVFTLRHDRHRRRRNRRARGQFFVSDGRARRFQTIVALYTQVQASRRVHRHGHKKPTAAEYRGRRRIQTRDPGY